MAVLLRSFQLQGGLDLHEGSLCGDVSQEWPIMMRLHYLLINVSKYSFGTLMLSIPFMMSEVIQLYVKVELGDEKRF